MPAQMWIPELAKAFDPNAAFSDRQFGNISVSIRNIGELWVPTGRIVACDPFVFAETLSFPQTIIPGKYPVMLSIAVLENDQRTGCAMLKLSDQPVSRWEMAVLPGQDKGSLKEREFFGYPVDSGTGCFMDEDSAHTLRTRLQQDDKYFEEIIHAMDKTYVNTWSWANIEVATERNVITFSSGFGDGLYGSYFGYDSSGRPACLVTDFGVFFVPYDQQEHPSRRWWQLWK
ncbi:MAG: DUF4241 domain-containing protein [Acidobacteriota bacterium]|nr:DUF4241 domain-containing protein [Acidobacteriota bacterium]